MFGGKFRDGITGVGRSTANWSEQDDQQMFLTRIRNDVRVQKADQFTDIFQKQPIGIDGFYSLGATVDQGTRIVGSHNGFNFTDRGPAPSQGGYTVPAILFYGKGKGSTNITKSTGSYIDFDNKACTAGTYNEYTTPNGRKLTFNHTNPTFVPFGRLDSYSELLHGGYVNIEGFNYFIRVSTVPQIDIDGQHVQSFIIDDGLGDFIHGQVITALNQIGWYASIAALAPGVVLKMDRYLRPHYTPTTIDATACPGLYFSYTTDGGFTWQEVSGAGLWDTEMQTITGINPHDDTNAAKFNQAIATAGMGIAPLSRRYSVIKATVPYVADNGDLMARVKMGIVDVAAGCTMEETQVLYDGRYDHAGYYGGRDMIGVKGGVLVLTRDVTTGPRGGQDSWMYPARVRFTPDGTNFTDRPPMPFKENYTGRLSGYDERTLVCPMWDGKHSLYVSKDFAQTWVRKGTIAEHGVPPYDNADGDPREFQYVLWDFGIVTYLQQDNLAANGYPMTPWLFDSRIKNAPIL